MKRTNITFDDNTYEYLRKKSFEDRKSMAEILRDLVKAQMTPEKKPLEHMESPRYMGASSKLSPDAKEIFNPQPKKEKKQ